MTLFRPEMLGIIFFGALATYLTRIGGYLLIKRLKTIPPRIEAGLDAVPAAVLTTLVAPTFVTGDFDASIALAISLVAGLRVTGITLIAIGWAVVMVLRYFT